jgi:ribosomal protein L35
LTNRTRSAEVLQLLQDRKNKPHTINRKKVRGTGHTLRTDSFLKHVIQGKTNGMGRRGRNHKQLLITLVKKDTES